MDYVPENFLGTLNDASIGLDTYMDFIGYNQNDVGLENGYSIPKRFYKQAKIVISKEGITIDFPSIISNIQNRYNLGAITDDAILEKSKDIQSIKTEEELKERYPELGVIFSVWKASGIKRYPAAIEKVEKKYSHFERTKRVIKERMAKGVTEEKLANYKIALADIERQIPISKAEAINRELVRLFIWEVVFEYKFYLNYKDAPKSALNKNNEHLLMPEKIRFYIAKSIYEKASFPDAPDKIKRTAYRYLSDFVDHVPVTEKAYNHLSSDEVSDLIDKMVTYINDYEANKGQGLK